MLQNIKNIFIENISKIRSIFLLAFVFLIFYYMSFYLNDNKIIKSFNIFSIISYFIDAFVDSYIKFVSYVILDNIVQIIILLCIFLISVFNKLIYQFPWQLLLSYLIILGLNNYIAINKLENVLNIINIFLVILFIPITLFALEKNYSNQDYANENIFIKFIIDKLQKYSSDKYITALIRIVLDIIFSFSFICKYYYLKIFFFKQVNFAFNWFFIINWLILFFLFRVFFLNSFLYRNLEQISQNKIAIFETSEYQNFIRINKLLINENFIFSIAFIYMIAFVYHLSLVHEYLYCILPSGIVLLVVNYFKKYLIK